MWFTGLRSLTVEPQMLLSDSGGVDQESDARYRMSQRITPQETLEISFKGKQTVVVKREGKPHIKLGQNSNHNICFLPSHFLFF